MNVLFVDDIGGAAIRRDPDTYIQYAAVNWEKCFTGKTEIIYWQSATIDEANDYDLVLIKLLPDPNIQRLNKALEIALNPGRSYKVIISIDDVVGWQFNSFPLNEKLLYTRVLKSVDYIIHFGLPQSNGYWDIICQGTPHFNITRPYPIETAKSIRGNSYMPEAETLIRIRHLADGTRKGLIALDNGLNRINGERNIISSLGLAKYLQQKTSYDIMAFVCDKGIEGIDREMYYREICGIENMIEIPSVSWLDYIKILSNVQYAIHLDCLETLGQFALCCACLKIPLICSGSHAAKALFPFTYLEHCRDIDQARIIVDQLLESETFSSQVIGFAFDKANEFSVNAIKPKLAQMLGVEEICL